MFRQSVSKANDFRISSERQKLDAVADVVGFVDESNQFQITDSLANRQVELMSVDQTSEGLPRDLVATRNGK